MRTQGRFTFESFLVKDDCVVLWRLRQTEKLASETREEEQMERGKWTEIEKTRKAGDKKERGEREWKKSVIHLQPTKGGSDFHNNSYQESSKWGSPKCAWFQGLLSLN